MDIGSILLGLALLLFVVFFISQPFLDRRRAVDNEKAALEDHQLSSLLAERDRVINALQELDFDYALGKVPEEDYPNQRARMLQYGADILRQIDAIEGKSTTGQPNAQATEDIIEASIAARRADVSRVSNTPAPAGASPSSNGGKVVPVAVAAPDDEMEILLANRRRARQDEAAGFCTKCGSALQKTDKFCPKCGNALQKN